MARDFGVACAAKAAVEARAGGLLVVEQLGDAAGGAGDVALQDDTDRGGLTQFSWRVNAAVRAGHVALEEDTKGGAYFSNGERSG